MKYKSYCSFVLKKINLYYVVFIWYFKYDILNWNKRGKCVDVFVYFVVIFVMFVYFNFWSDKRFL